MESQVPWFHSRSSSGFLKLPETQSVSMWSPPITSISLMTTTSSDGRYGNRKLWHPRSIRSISAPIKPLTDTSPQAPFSLYYLGHAVTQKRLSIQTKSTHTSVLPLSLSLLCMRATVSTYHGGTGWLPWQSSGSATWWKKRALQLWIAAVTRPGQALSLTFIHTHIRTHIDTKPHTDWLPMTPHSNLVPT